MGIQFEANSAIDMLAINFSNLTHGTPTTATSSKYELRYNGGYRDVFEGHGFKYDKSDIPNGGTVEDFTEYKRSNELFEISGMSVSVKALVKAAFTADTTDDLLLIIKEMNGNDRVTGSNGNDTLFAAGGNDKINGRGGNDVLLSGPGVDTMTGGTGTDAFVFLEGFHSDLNSRDTITDFAHGDVIHLTNLGSGTFIGMSSFSGAAGEVRYTQEGGDTFIHGDFNGDTLADFSVRLKGVITLTQDDFAL
jgi:Ca2+-binding RTX toxin-like protein